MGTIIPSYMVGVGIVVGLLHAFAAVLSLGLGHLNPLVPFEIFSNSFEIKKGILFVKAGSGST